MLKVVLAVAVSASLLLAASSGLSQELLKSPSAMTLDELKTATLKNLGLLNALQREILRRHPKARPFEGYDPAGASVSQEVERQMQGLSDDQLVQAMATGSARIDALASEGSRRLSGQAGPGPAAPAAPRQSRAPAPAERAPYCKAMYGKAYSLCGREDRSCKFLAASHWEECEKTGQWRD